MAINLSIDKYLVEEKCCKRAYVVGAFLGSGSVIIPQIQKKTGSGYHLEFVFSKYQTALDFSSLMSEEGFFPKLINRKENFVVYFKGCDEICELLFYLGATKCRFDLENVIIEKGLRNETNRRINCEMANIEKQVNAAQNQIHAINLIDETIGLEELPSNLVIVAKARLENSESSFGELAKILNLSKSCLNHRLRKIMEIANNL